jgi:hypothetical protein
VVVLPDNDAPGLAHARQVVELTAPLAASLRVLELPALPPKGDVSDWLDAGGDAATLRQLAQTAPPAADWLAAQRPRPDAERGERTATTEELITPLTDVPAQTVAWLWQGRLARGKVAILDGDPGLGKSLVTLDLCACITRGRPFPDGRPAAVGNVLIANCEDGVADTIRPRLESLGAAVERVSILRGRKLDGVELALSLPSDIRRLRRAILEASAVLTVIDPIMAFLDDTIMSGNDQSVRQALAPLAAVAEETGCAMLLVRHLNKTGGGKAIYRGGGSIDIIGACRSAWLIGRHPEAPRQRVLAQVKNNLGPPQPSLAFEIAGDEQGRPQLAWLGEVDLDADQLMAAPAAAEDSAALPRAVELLRQSLRDGPRPADELIAELAKQGVSRRTLFRAKLKAGVVSQPAQRGRKGGVTIWQLAEVTAEPPAVVEPGRRQGELDLKDGYRRSPEDGPYYREP